MAEPTYYSPRSGGDFRRVLSRLASDSAYREAATRDPDLIAKDFKLTLKELQALRQVAIMSGADVTQVNQIRAQEIRTQAAERLATDIDVSCCSCCCCCCGETAVVPLPSVRSW